MVAAKSRALFLIHWNQREVSRLAEGLIDAGWEVEVEAEDGARAAKRILANPPKVVVIYLNRLPSHGRETARYLQTLSAVPIIFVDGAEEKLGAMQKEAPDATFVRSTELFSTLDALG